MHLIVLTGLSSHLKADIAQALALPIVAPSQLAVAEHETAVYIAPESVAPDDLLMQLDAWQEQMPDLTIRTIAVIDERTCACFPNLEATLRDYADITVTSLDDVAEIML